jgi:glutaredoxin 3
VAKVLIYTGELCPYCDRAKRLLTAKGVAFEEIDVTYDATRRAEMMLKSGRRTMPQIWIGATHVGGSDDLHALDRRGELDALLAG